MRRTLLFAAAASSLLLAPHAGAAPGADVEKAAAASVHLDGPNGGVEVVLLASTTSSGVARLRVDVGPYSTPRLYGAVLPAGALSIDGSGATLRTRLGREPLVVTWRVSSYAISAFMGQETGQDAATEGWHAAGNGADVQVRLGRVTCSTTGLLGTAVTHDDGTYGAPAGSAPRFTTRAGTCRDSGSKVP